MYDWLDEPDIKECVTLRYPFFRKAGVPECNIDWNDVIDNLKEPEFLGKGGFVDEQAYAPGSVRAFADEVNKRFPSRTGDMSIHMYGSFSTDANTSGKHRDTANVFIVGALGQLEFTVYADDNMAKQEYLIMPGDVLFVPRSRWHEPAPLTPRAIFSIGLEYGKHADDD